MERSQPEFEAVWFKAESIAVQFVQRMPWDPMYFDLPGGGGRKTMCPVYECATCGETSHACWFKSDKTGTPKYKCFQCFAKEFRYCAYYDHEAECEDKGVDPCEQCTECTDNFEYCGCGHLFYSLVNENSILCSNCVQWQQCEHYNEHGRRCCSCYQFMPRPEDLKYHAGKRKCMCSECFDKLEAKRKSSVEGTSGKGYFSRYK